MRRKLRVLFAAFEADPFMKAGGLGDVIGTLPRALKTKGCEARVMIPKFGSIDEKYKSQMTHVTDFYVNLGWRSQYCGVEKLEYNGVTFYFLDNEYYFDRAGAYGFFDDGERTAFFSKAVVESLQYLPDFKCDILHLNDYHSALSAVFLREFYCGLPLYDNVKTVFTVHNLKFQGQYSNFVLDDILGLAGIPAAAAQLTVDKDSINYMKGALSYSDVLTTVSPTYAEEIKTPFFGEQMETIFQRRAKDVYGILNGIDVMEYNPEIDPHIAASFTAADKSGKAACKRALQKELGLHEDADAPLIVMIGRLTEQKGLDLLKSVGDEIMSHGVQMVVLGTGDAVYENTFRTFEARYPGSFCAYISFDSLLSHRMYAGADMLLMPSLFEPCGLSQMIAMRYGTLPVVRETGGLKDSVVPYNQFTGEGTGFSFSNFNAHEMMFKIFEAVALYREDKCAWEKLMTNAMESDFSWDKAADEYVKVYQSLHPEITLWK